MKNILLALALIILNGCSSTPNQLLTRQYSLTLSPPGGEYSKWVKKLEKGFCYTRVRLSPKRIKPHDKWDSMASVRLAGQDDFFLLGVVYSKKHHKFYTYAKFADGHREQFPETFQLNDRVDLILMKQRNGISVSILPASEFDSLEGGETRDLYGNPVELHFDVERLELVASGADIEFSNIDVTETC